MLAGANRLALQNDAGAWEVIGFAEAELVSAGRYRLRQLLRGQLGTGPAMGAISAGRAVMLLDSRVGTVPVEAQWLGEERAFRLYAGSGDLEGTPLTVATTPQVARPLPPVHVRAERTTGGVVSLGWVRCSRADGDGWEAGDAPLEFMPEVYRVTILKAGVPVRTINCATPAATYSATDQVSDFGALPASFVFTVAQLSASLGAGHASSGAFHG